MVPRVVCRLVCCRPQNFLEEQATGLGVSVLQDQAACMLEQSGMKKLAVVVVPLSRVRAILLIDRSPVRRAARV